MASLTYVSNFCGTMLVKNIVNVQTSPAVTQQGACDCMNAVFHYAGLISGFKQTMKPIKWSVYCSAKPAE